MLLLDAGVWVASGAPANRWHDSASGLVRKPPGPLAALDLTLYEVANAVGVRDGKPDMAKALTQILQRRCRNRIVAFDAELLDVTLEVAAEYDLSAYDAALSLPRVVTAGSSSAPIFATSSPRASR